MLCGSLIFYEMAANGWQQRLAPFARTTRIYSRYSGARAVTQEESQQVDTLQLATELAVAWLSNPNTRAGADDVPAFLGSVQSALVTLSSQPRTGDQPTVEQQEYTPAVTVRKSLANPDHILSMIDGKPYKTLRRHLARHGLTPEEYRQRYGLKPDYPMTAAGYSEVRRAMAKKIGLGRKGGAGEPAANAPEPKQSSAVPAAKPARGRRRKAAAAASAA
jgi:predicted transcriptional regulator